MNRIVCGRQDCIHNRWCKCSLKNVAIGKDLVCHNYHLTSQKDTVDYEEKSIKILNHVRLRQDRQEDWVTVSDCYPSTTSDHTHHGEWRENVFQPVPMRGEKSK